VTQPNDLASIVQSFRDTNSRLSQLADAAQLLTESSAAFETASTHAAELIRSSIVDTQSELAKVIAASSDTLETSQRALRDTASSLTRLTDQLKDASRELADVADAFRKTEPEALLRAPLAAHAEHRRRLLRRRASDVGYALRDLGSRPPEHFATRFGGVEGGIVAMYHGDAGYDHDDPNRPGPRHRLWMLADGWRYERDPA
jgi:chromosome segregation ATPase